MLCNHSSAKRHRPHDRRHAFTQYLACQIALLIFLFCSSCHSPETTHFNGIAMTIPYCVQVGDQNVNSEQLKHVIIETFQEIDLIYNNWNEQSEISQLNRLAAYEKKKLSTKLEAFLLRTQELVKKTDRLFDPTVAPLSKIWKEHLQNGSVPPVALLEPYEKAVGWEKIHIEDGYFWKEHDLCALDLGGIAKGYAVDLLIENLKELGLKSLYVEWGGEIRTLGLHPQKRAWKIGILGESAIELTNQAIATSGSYYQLWRIDNMTYTHIINPITKRPIQNPPITSISVIAANCLEADALATALMVFPDKGSAHQWAKAKEIAVIVPGHG